MIWTAIALKLYIFSSLMKNSYFLKTKQFFFRSVLTVVCLTQSYSPAYKCFVFQCKIIFLSPSLISEKAFDRQVCLSAILIQLDNKDFLFFAFLCILSSISFIGSHNESQTMTYTNRTCYTYVLLVISLIDCWLINVFRQMFHAC